MPIKRNFLVNNFPKNPLQKFACGAKNLVTIGTYSNLVELRKSIWSTFKKKVDNFLKVS